MSDGKGFTRRAVLAGAGATTALGAGVAAGVFAGTRGDGDDSETIDLSAAYDFYTGSHQHGVETPPQRHSVYMTFDVVSGATTRDLQVLLARWSAAIAQLMAGKPVGLVQPADPNKVPADTGEALDLGPASLTVTLGLGPDFFAEEHGLARFRPALLEDLPRLPSDSLQPSHTGGAISLQACADDPQVAYHAIRDLARMARGTVTTRWTVMGFGRASAGQGQSTPRNLLGFKDGTRNITEQADYDRFVWIEGENNPDQPWLEGATYQVVRKVQMRIETWDAQAIKDQEQIFARTKGEGAPLSGTKEFDTPDFADSRIDPTSHVALSAPENNGGVKILRRGYNYTDGINQYGQLDAGLLFIAYMNTPAHFVQLQTRLGASDLLNEYISHIGSGLFVVPPAPAEGHYIAEELFAS